MFIPSVELGEGKYCFISLLMNPFKLKLRLLIFKSCNKFENCKGLSLLLNGRVLVELCVAVVVSHCQQAAGPGGAVDVGAVRISTHPDTSKKNGAVTKLLIGLFICFSRICQLQLFSQLLKLGQIFSIIIS